MKNIIILSILAAVYAFPVNGWAQTKTPDAITWYTVEKAAELNAKKHKKIMMDVYTSWCSWCKKMDAETFRDPEVVAYMNENFYAVKLNAEEKAPIKFEGKVYLNPSPDKYRSVHEFAAMILQGQMSYPSYAFLDGHNKPVTNLPGYHKAPEFLKVLKYIAEDQYKKMSWQEYANKTDK
jgi:thioredoxin-related protein